MSFPLQHLEGKYEIIEKIAEGGMGAVYKVRHRLLDEVRVIKVMRPQLEHQEEIKSRFLREAKIAVRMRHPNIAQMYDFSIDDAGNSSIVMEFIDGVTLQDLLKRSGPPGVALSLEIAQQSLQALGYLHHKGIVHRDISPDNLMLGQDEVGDPAVKLIDLGIAKPSHGESNLTATGLFLGKIKYASPEHFKASEGVLVDQRSDLYSFGLVLYELLTGVHPIAGTNWSELIAGHLFERPRDFATTDPEGRIPEELRQVVLTSLAKSPDDRFPDAKAFRRAILHLQTGFPLVREEFERILKGRERDRATKPATKPGSTQDRLDVQFGVGRETPAAAAATDGIAALEKAASDSLPTESRDIARERTPPPAPTRALHTTPSATDSRTQERVRELIGGARRLADLNLHEQARLQAQAALNLDPGNRETTTLLERIEAGQRRSQVVARAVEDIERLIATESFDGALERLDSAAAAVGEAEELSDLRVRVEQLEAQKRFARAAALIREAQDLAQASAFREAIARLEQAEDLDPANTVVRSHLAEVREAMRAHEEAQRRTSQVAEALAAVQDLISARRLDEARAQLDQALARFGLDPALTPLIDQLAQAEAQRLAAEVSSLVAEATNLLVAGDHEQAIAGLERALQLDPRDATASARLTEARQALQAHEEATQRAAEVAQAAAAVEGLIAAKRFAKARARLDQALASFGLEPSLLALGDRILGLEGEQRANAVSALLAEARTLLAVDDFRQAIARLERALELDPDNAAASARLTEARQALQGHEESARHAAEVAATVSGIEPLLASGELDRALDRVAQAVRRLGEEQALAALKARILKTKEEQRAAQVEELARAAEAATARGDHAAAVKWLEEAQKVDPGSRVVKAQLGRAKDSLRRHEEEDRARAAEAERAAALAGQREEATILGPTPRSPEDRTVAVSRPDATVAFPALAGADLTAAIQVPELREPPPAALPRPPERAPVVVPARPAAPPVEPVRPKPEVAAAPKPAALPVERRPRTGLWLALAVAAAVVVTVTAVLVLRGGKGAATGPTGTMVINAVPWAEVESVVDADNKPRTLSAARFTPLTLQLPAGRYRVSLRNPARSEALVVEAEIKAGETASAPLAKFGELDAAQVLEKYGL